MLNKQKILRKLANCLIRIDTKQLHAINASRNNKLNASLNNFQKRNASAFKFIPDIAPPSLGETTKMNLYQSVTNALDISLSADKSAGIYIFLIQFEIEVEQRF